MGRGISNWQAEQSDCPLWCCHPQRYAMRKSKQKENNGANVTWFQSLTALRQDHFFLKPPFFYLFAFLQNTSTTQWQESVYHITEKLFHSPTYTNWKKCLHTFLFFVPFPHFFPTPSYFSHCYTQKDEPRLNLCDRWLMWRVPAYVSPLTVLSHLFSPYRPAALCWYRAEIWTGATWVICPHGLEQRLAKSVQPSLV